MIRKVLVAVTLAVCASYARAEESSCYELVESTSVNISCADICPPEDDVKDDRDAWPHYMQSDFEVRGVLIASARKI